MLYIQSGALQDIAFHLPRSESDTRGSRIALLGSNRGGGAHDHLDAMNTGHAALTWLSTVGIGSIRVRRSACEWRPCNGGWDGGPTPLMNFVNSTGQRIWHLPVRARIARVLGVE